MRFQPSRLNSGALLMRLPRTRFTVRGMMVAVAVLALAVWLPWSILRSVSPLGPSLYEPMDDPLETAERLLAEGEDLADAGDDAEALVRFRAAWSALPEPREEQEPAIRIQAAIADSYFYLGEWEDCRRAVQHAFRCGAEPDNPFLRLRLGQSLYELGDEQEAANWLVPAYLSEGRSLFDQDDPKYLEFFRSELQPPPGGWPEGW